MSTALHGENYKINFNPKPKNKSSAPLRLPAPSATLRLCVKQTHHNHTPQLSAFATSDAFAHRHQLHKLHQF